MDLQYSKLVLTVLHLFIPAETVGNDAFSLVLAVWGRMVAARDPLHNQPYQFYFTIHFSSSDTE